MIVDAENRFGEEASVRLRLSAIGRLVLSQWRQGYDAYWSAGEPPSEVGLDETPPSGSDVPGELDPIAATAWNFLEAFVDARWHGFRDLDGIPWDAAIVLLEQVVDRLDRNLPITDPRLKPYRVTVPNR